jgi:transcriptional regulator with XRE-family HTH domain
MNWLGILSVTQEENEVDEVTLDWQQWVMNTLGKLRQASATSGILSWERLAKGLVHCTEIVGSSKELSSLAGISKQSLSSWQNGKQIPIFESFLEFCYVLDISPLLLIINNKEALKESLHAREIHRQPRPKHNSPKPVNRKQALTLIQAVLDGRVAPMGVRQLERYLGLGARVLIYHFPQECAEVTAQYQAYRAEQARQRIERGCNEVRQVTLSLCVDGANPSAQRVASKLSDPGMMRTREGLTAWHAARRELGLES